MAARNSDAEKAQLYVIGQNVKEGRRRQARLRQVDLAVRSGVAYRHLQDIEAGKVNVTVSTLVRLSLALRCPVSFLITPRFP